MKVKYILSALFFWLATVNLYASLPEPMSPPRLVNDFAGLLSNSENKTLEEKLRWYNDSTSTQISIVTIKDLEGYEVADYANELARKWGIGEKGKNNGILILVSLSPRKVTIQTGYGVEALLPDVVCGRIIRETIAPNFKSGNYFNGFDQAVDEIYARLTGAYVNDKTEEIGTEVIVFIIIIIFVILFIISRINRNRKGTFTKRGYYNNPDIWINPGGGGWFDGGGGSSGGGGGIDFGGFGGGDFGGGGASGDW